MIVSKMDKEILSLKNLYRFLVENDYPVYSAGILTEKNCRGLTLSKFWQENIVYEFKNGKCGKLIWRTEGGRNRYLSEIYNRSERLNFYEEYEKEITDSIDSGICLEQVETFMNFFISRQFSYEVFMQKFNALLELYQNTDEYFTDEISEFFKQEKNNINEIAQSGDFGQAFCSGWFLTFLSFYAMAGNQMSNMNLSKLCDDEKIHISSLWKIYLQKNNKYEEPVTFLTNKNTALCSQPLLEKHFFGRELEIFELRELVKEGGRYLLSGMGGAGKTELLRQLLKNCVEEKLVDAICVIQYSGSLEDSFARAFSNVCAGDSNHNFNEALGIIRSYEKKNVLILIDNVNSTTEEDASLSRLQNLPGTIFITSRSIELEGFETYFVKSPAKEMSMLIFRDNYGKLLTEEDRFFLNEIVEQESWNHILTLRLLGKAAQVRNWSVRELKEHLEKGDKHFTWKDGAGTSTLSQIYSKMYPMRQFRKNQMKLLRILAVLPYDSFSLEFADYFFSELLEQRENMEEELEKLVRIGLLEKSIFLEEDQTVVGYSMHPIISECVVKNNIKEEECKSFLEKIGKVWEQQAFLSGYSEEEGKWTATMKDIKESQKAVKLGTMVLSIAKRLKGALSRECLYQVLKAARLVTNVYGYSIQTQQLLKKIINSSKDVSEELRIYYYVIECEYNSSKKTSKRVEEILRQQEKNRTISNYLYIELCLYAGDSFIFSGREKEAEELTRIALSQDCSISQQIQAYYNMAMLKRFLGNWDDMLYWAEKGLKMEEESGHIEHESEKAHIMIGEIAVTLSLRGKQKESEETLKKLEQITEKSKNLIMEARFNYYKGIVESTGGHAEAAIPYLEKAVEKIKYFSDTDTHQYVQMLGELAIVQNRTGNSKAAVVNYKKIIQIWRQEQESPRELSRILNNMAVLYLDMKMPKEAAEALEEAYEIGKGMGGLAMAEPSNNLARAWRMLGEEIKERFYLNEAYPILRKCYGEENQKVINAKTRLKELKM